VFVLKFPFPKEHCVHKNVDSVILEKPVIKSSGICAEHDELADRYMSIGSEILEVYFLHIYWKFIRETHITRKQIKDELMNLIHKRLNKHFDGCELNNEFVLFHYHD